MGTFADGECATNIEIAGLSGFDFVIIDDEHGCHNNPNKLELVRTAENAGIVPIFRVPGFSFEDSIKKVLDMGAGGILVPNISTRSEAEQAICHSKFPPIGKRGACPYKRSNDYGAKYGLRDYYARSNEEVSVMFLIENTQAVEEFDGIIGVDGLDAILFGRDDMSVSMGIPGEYENPALLSSIRSMIRRSREKGIPAGMVCFDYDDTMRWLADDVDFITLAMGPCYIIRSNQALIGKIRGKKSPATGK